MDDFPAEFSFGALVSWACLWGSLDGPGAAVKVHSGPAQLRAEAVGPATVQVRYQDNAGVVEGWLQQGVEKPLQPARNGVNRQLC
jgi:hypothetical protein